MRSKRISTRCVLSDWETTLLRMVARENPYLLLQGLSAHYTEHSIPLQTWGHSIRECAPKLVGACECARLYQLVLSSVRCVTRSEI